MKAAPFKYVRPETLEEVLAVLADHGEDVRLMAGGQSLGAMLNMRIVTPTILLDLNRVTSLATIDGSKTGALVRQRDALDHAGLRQAVPLLAQALPYVGHYQTRNRGTLGGSVAHADPSAEIPLTLATLGGAIELSSKRRKRQVTAVDFFHSALVTARESHEVVSSLQWPVMPRTARSTFLEFAIREGDFAVVAVACIFDSATKTVRIGFGGCGESPQVITRKNVGDLNESAVRELIDEATRSLEYRSDILASSAYRRQLAAVLGRRALAAVLDKGAAHA